jgi:hypothetical protein
MARTNGFGFIARPSDIIYVKPRITKLAAEKYNYNLFYEAKPDWETYQSILGFTKKIISDTQQLRPLDMIDVQSFIWVLGSEEYPDL